jgi:hypothetical protein
MDGTLRERTSDILPPAQEKKGDREVRDRRVHLSRPVWNLQLQGCLSSRIVKWSWLEAAQFGESLSYP